MTSRRIRAANVSGAVVFGKARKALDDCETVPGTVRVHVEDGTVTLTGSVERLAQRTDAERAVRPVIGNRRLVNKITVGNVPDAEELAALPAQHT